MLHAKEYAHYDSSTTIVRIALLAVAVCTRAELRLSQVVLRDLASSWAVCRVRPARCHEEGQGMTGTSPFSAPKGGCTKSVSMVSRVAYVAEFDSPVMVFQSTRSKR